MFTKAQAQKLIAKSEARLEVFREVHEKLRGLFDTAMDIQHDPLWEFDNDFTLTNEHCRDYWGGIEDALEGLYKAQCALNRLANIEQRKIAKTKNNISMFEDLEAYGYLTDD